ncbi:MAG: RNA-binding domain-containing protein [Candidatus Odinarchaeia archaeon]
MIKFKEIEFEVFSHATEDKQKVISAVKNLIPPDFHSGLEICENMLIGHYHNPIIKINILLSNDHAVLETLYYIFSSMSKNEKDNILKRLSSFIDDSGTLYIRLNKQDAYNHKISLKTEPGSIIRISVHILKKGPLTREEILEKYKEILRS